MRQPPADYADSGETLLRNCDNFIDSALAARLKSEKITANFTGWEFFGVVWNEADEFHCLVMRHRIERDTFSSATIEELRELVRNVYGSD